MIGFGFYGVNGNTREYVSMLSKGSMGAERKDFPLTPGNRLSKTIMKDFINKPSTIKNQDFVNDGLLSVF